MKKIIVLIVIILSPILTHAQDYDISRRNSVLVFDPPKQKNFWATAEIAGVVNLGNISSDVAPPLKFGANFGGTFWKGIGAEVSFKSYLQKMVNLQYPEANEQLITSLGQMNIGVRAVYRPSFMLDDFPMMFISPYIGAGVNIAFLPSYSIVKRPDSRETFLHVAPSAKVGVHYSVLNFLIGVSAEYTFFSSSYMGSIYDFSNLSIGFEMGAAF